jgi:hypothetical protein
MNKELPPSAAEDNPTLPAETNGFRIITPHLVYAGVRMLALTGLTGYSWNEIAQGETPYTAMAGAALILVSFWPAKKD